MGTSQLTLKDIRKAVKELKQNMTPRPIMLLWPLPEGGFETTPISMNEYGRRMAALEEANK